MSTTAHAITRGNLALNILRLALLATSSALVGVLLHLVWKAFAG
jgi:hypothetical protein